MSIIETVYQAAQNTCPCAPAIISVATVAIYAIRNHIPEYAEYKNRD